MATDQEYKYEEISVQVESKGELFEAKEKRFCSMDGNFMRSVSRMTKEWLWKNFVHQKKNFRK